MFKMIKTWGKKWQKVPKGAKKFQKGQKKYQKQNV